MTKTALAPFPVASAIFALVLNAGVLGCGSRPSPAVEELMTASRRGDLEGIERALAAGADVNAREPDDHETALYRAARMGEAEAVLALLEAGADPDIGDRRSVSPLHVAARSGSSAVVAALLEGGATVDAREDQQGKTPLHEAAYELQPDVARLLLEAGADPNARLKWDPSPALAIAVRQSNLELAEHLVKAGADGSLDDGSGPLIHQALALAHDEDPEMLRLLIDGGASLEQKDDEGRTVVEAARYYLAQETGASWVAKRQRVLESLEAMEAEQ